MATDKGQEDNDLQNTTQETKDKQHDLDIMYKTLHRKLKISNTTLTLCTKHYTGNKDKQHDLDIMYKTLHRKLKIKQHDLDMYFIMI